MSGSFVLSRRRAFFVCVSVLLNRCALNLIKTCTALTLNPFLGAQTVPLYKKCSKKLHSAVAPLGRLSVLTRCASSSISWYAKSMSIRIISICSVRHFVMLTPSSETLGEHPNVYYMLCVAHSDARWFFKYIKLLTTPYKKRKLHIRSLFMSHSVICNALIINYIGCGWCGTRIQARNATFRSILVLVFTAS